jgi:hypothetical protein
VKTQESNLAEYMQSNGPFDLLSFFDHHKGLFPCLNIHIQHEASRAELLRWDVRGERFSSTEDYISAQPL